MDMRRHLRRWLNDAELRRRGDSYEGVIETVTEESVRNRFTAQREIQPVITFDDGWRIIPNFTMRAALIEMLGPETEAWKGRKVTVLRKRVERLDKTSGEVKGQWVKGVCCADPHARFLRTSPRAPKGGATVVPIVERADYDDSDEALAEAHALHADDTFGTRRRLR